MEAEKFFSLYESCWFELEILNNNKASSISETEDPTETTKPETSQQAPIHHHKRSMSDQINTNTSFGSEFSSPQKLETILSGKEISGLESPEKQSVRFTEPPRKNRRERRKRKGHESKSLSELEFEELKGFMDLGFVFSEEDRDSSLASIIPGLHRLGKNNNRKDIENEEEEKEEEENKKEDLERDFDGPVVISRPYLSEAWEVFDLKPKRDPLMKWRFPALSNEIDMKDNLRWWAHTVASTVR